MRKFVMGLVLAAGWCGAATLYVSPDGNNAWTGFSVRRDFSKAGEGPLATLDGARMRVRALRAAGRCAARETVQVIFSAGEYPLTQTVAFDPEDSFVHYRAAPEAEVTITGGRKYSGFRAGTDGIWRMPLPRDVTFEQLYMNGSRMQRAKSPNAFYFSMREPVPYGTDPVTGRENADLSHRAFLAAPEDLRGLEGLSPAACARVVVRAFHSWEVSQARLQKVDVKTGLVIGTASAPWPYFRWKPYLPRFVLENYRAALDAPGEWFADLDAGELLYLPRPGEDPARTEIVIPCAEQFLLFRGNALADRWIQDVRFEGIRFHYTAYRLPPGGQGNGQAAVSQSAAIEADGCRGLVFHDCEIAHTGAHGIRLRKGCRDSAVTHCRITDLGGGAIYLGDTAWSKAELPDRLTGHIRVDNNILQDGGHIFPGAIGVWIGNAADVELTHNDISDFYYTGISVGWTWGYRETVTRRNVLAFNHIHHIGRGVLNDMGAIYTLGDQAGSFVTNNHIHDVWSYDYSGRGGWGLYTDEGSANLVFENNLVHRVKTGCVHQHYGKNNVFRNNIFALSLDGQIQRSRVEDHRTIIVTNNIIYWDNDTPAVWRGYSASGKADDMLFDHNVYWNPHGMGPSSFQGRSWETWRKEGQDVHSSFVDPLFADPQKGDFRLAPASPAPAAGFRPFDPGLAGVYGDAAWKRLADRPHAPFRFAPVPEIRVVTRVETGFEALPEGRSDPLFTNSQEGKGDAIRATGRVVYRGKKSLQILDAPGLRFRFNPHFFLETAMTNGCVENRFAIRLDKGSVVFNEWRDSTSPGPGNYRRGPSLLFQNEKLFVHTRKAKADGTLAAVREEVMALPSDVWIEFAVRCSLDKRTPDGLDWTLDVKGNNIPAVSKTFRVVDPAFARVDWLGFGSDATNAVSFYLDEFFFGKGSR